MELLLFLALIVFVCCIPWMIKTAWRSNQLASLSDSAAASQKAQWEAKDRQKAIEELYGPLNEHVICPHCNGTSCVHTKMFQAKKGISGGKATAAVLTGGVSLLAVGLSRKELNTHAHCSKCESNWVF